MHNNHRCLMTGNDFPHGRIPKPIYVIDNHRHPRKTRRDDFGLGGVYGNRYRKLVRKRIKHGQYPSQFLIRRHAYGSRTRGLPADINDICALASHGEGVSDSARRIKKSSAVAETVGRHIQNPDDAWVVKRDRICSAPYCTHLEPPLGFEPRTYCLQNSCSAAELRWRKKGGRASKNATLPLRRSRRSEPRPCVGAELRWRKMTRHISRANPLLLFY